MQKPPLKRDQHPGFGIEIRQLGGSRNKKDKELVGIIHSELAELAALKANGQRHQCEDHLHGGLSDIQYLRLYRYGCSTRLYWMILDGRIWMLALDPNKRQDGLSAGIEHRLRDRFNDVLAEVARRRRATKEREDEQ